MIHSLHLDSFYLTEEQLENSPSRQDGIDKDTEANLRMYGCEIIQEAGIMLSFDQVVMATGQVLLHRFYCKRSMKTFNVKKVSATALWVAAKLEEVKEVRDHPRKLLEMVMVAVDRSINRRETLDGRKLAVLDTHSKEGEEFRRALIRYESEMLKAFGFIMNVEHPHRLLCNYCQILFAPYMSKDDKWDFLRGFIQESWNVANDSLRTNLCVRFKGSVVACGIIFYTGRKLQVPLPDNWWELFTVKLEDICDVCRILHELYLTPKPSFVPVCHQLLPSKPPTPAIGAGGAAVKGGPVTATPTPMVGATPELNTRPGDKPLDPSIRRMLPASESTPNLAAAPAAATNGAGGGSALQSPVDTAAPGSARKRSRSRSPGSPADESRKRQQLGSSQPQASPSEQLQDKARATIAAAGKAKLSRPLSRPPSDRDRDSRDNKERGAYDRGSRRDKPRSRSRDNRSKRSRSRDRKRSRSRDSRSRRSRSRDRKRSRSRDKSRRSRSRSRDRRRSRSRDRRRERDHKDSRSRSARDNREGPDKGRELKSPAKPASKQPQQQPAAKYPSPPALPAASSPMPEKDARDAATALPPPPPRGSDGSSKEQQQRGSRVNGVGRGSEQLPQHSKSAAADSAVAGDKAMLPLKPKPKAVRKQHPSGAVASPVSSPNSQGDKGPASTGGTD